ncbi:MAG TPA: tRNA (N6-isopentenyl adenosine(37)-C2)-methylthiotransferase MiaB [Elusimicrobiota bacterium]|nr:tRNA (N6-isopentenyl adenosine(37)-C2)-methylthiotransferase MiaB [Elusimicrobiota bacterium]
MKLHTIALGCQMSEADAEEMSAPLATRGFAKADTPEEADVILISTCTVRQHAEDRAISLIGSLRPWKTANPNRVLIVSGCAAERAGDSIRQKFPYVDLIVGAKSVERFPEIVQETLDARFDALKEQQESFAPEILPPAVKPGGRAVPDALPGNTLASGAAASPVSAYLTIMRGCNYSCSYCIVPSVRGRELYRPVEDILGEARTKTAAGAKEIMLLGQTVNSYESENPGGEVGFGDLLRLLDQTPGLERLRFMSPHPYYVDESMLSAMAECRSVCEHLHLPLQSASERVLKLMRRNYTPGAYLEKTRAARAAVPGIVISTDIIVGFPTETEEDFQETLDFLKNVRPAWAYCFKYSPRQGTQSASWPDDVSREVKEDRLKRLNQLMDELTSEALKTHVGKTAEVLCEEPGFGRTRGGFNAKWPGTARPGAIASLAVTGATKRTLLGELHESETI